jgi:hypothetical protein
MAETRQTRLSKNLSWPSLCPVDNTDTSQTTSWPVSTPVTDTYPNETVNVLESGRKIGDVLQKERTVPVPVSTLFKKITLTGSAPGRHPKNTLRVLIKGKKERRLDEFILEDLFTCELNINRSQIINVYNLGKPSEWYISLKSDEIYNSLHLVVICEHSDYCSSMLLLHVDKNGQRGHLKWVPPTITQNMINKIMIEISEPDTIVSTLKIGKSDKWAVDFCPNAPLKDLPHYIDLEIGGETYTLLLQLNGRRSICPLCGTTKHGPAACRSPYVRERDNIYIDNDGNYYDNDLLIDDSEDVSDDAAEIEPAQEPAQESTTATAPTTEGEWTKVQGKRNKPSRKNK